MSSLRFTRRLCLTVAVSGFAALWCTLPQAQTAWPTRAVTIVVPFPPGGGTAIGPRILAHRLSQFWGQAVGGANKGGARGTGVFL